MLNLRRFILVVLSLTVLLAFTTGAMAQDAKALLKKGIEQCSELNFKAAKASLQKVDRASLSDASKRTLNSYIQKAQVGLTEQNKALAAMKSARAAMKTGKFAEAKAGFKLASESEFLQAQQKKDATNEMALADAKEKEAIALAAKPKTESKPKAESKPKTNGETERLMAMVEENRERVKQLVAQGEAQLKRGEFGAAQVSFSKALERSPKNEKAAKGLARAKAALQNKKSSEIVDDTIRRRALRKQVAELEFEKHLNKAMLTVMATSKADYDKAASEAHLAKGVIDRERILFTDAEYTQKSREVANRLDLIARSLAQWQSDRARERGKALIIEEKKRRNRVAREKKRKIDTLMARARSLNAQYKYKLANQEVEQILNIEPSHSWALGQRDLLSNFISLMDEKGLVNTQMREIRKTLVDLRRSEIPWYELLRYPKDWKEMTIRRRPFAVGSAAETEADRSARLKLRQKLPKVDFDDVPFELVVNFLREASGLSIYVSWGALQVANVDKTTEVNVHLVDVTFEKALRIILDNVSGSSVGTPEQIDFVVEDGIVRITTREALSHNVDTRVYDIRDLIVPMPDVVVPERIGLSGTSSSSSSGSGSRGGSGGSRRGGGGGGLFDSGDTNTDTEDETQDELVLEIVDLVRETIDRDSWGGGAAAIRSLGGQLVVTQTTENHAALLDLINQLREARTMQIAVETRFITVSTGFLNSIGLNLNLYFNLGSHLGWGAGGEPATVTDPVSGAPVPYKGPSTWEGMGHSNIGGSDTYSTVGIVQNNTFTGFSNLTTGVGSGGGIASNFSAPGMQIQGTFLDDIQVDFLINATQAHSETKTLNAPRITLLNGTAAMIQVGIERAYVSEVDVEVVTVDNVSTIAMTYTTDYFQTGTQLYVRGTISADRRYVTMTIVPSLQELLNLRWFPGDPDLMIAAGWTGGFVQLPELSVKTLTTVVSVPDGGTLLLGGLKLSGEVEREVGVPLLSKIPILNRLTTNRAMARDESTLLILVKPTIIIQKEEEERRFNN